MLKHAFISEGKHPHDHKHTRILRAVHYRLWIQTKSRRTMNHWIPRFIAAGGGGGEGEGGTYAITSILIQQLLVYVNNWPSRLIETWCRPYAREIKWEWDLWQLNECLISICIFTYGRSAATFWQQMSLMISQFWWLLLGGRYWSGSQLLRKREPMSTSEITSRVSGLIWKVMIVFMYNDDGNNDEENENDGSNDVMMMRRKWWC